MSKKPASYGERWTLEETYRVFGEDEVRAFASKKDLENWGGPRRVPPGVIVKLYQRYTAAWPPTPKPPDLREVLKRIEDYYNTSRWPKVKIALDLIGPPAPSRDGEAVTEPSDVVPCDPEEEAK